MRRVFKGMLGAMMFGLLFSSLGFAEDLKSKEAPAAPKKISDAERKKIEDQMRGFAGGLGGMPTLPRIQGTIMLPDPDSGEKVSNEE